MEIQEESERLRKEGKPSNKRWKELNDLTREITEMRAKDFYGAASDAALGRKITLTGAGATSTCWTRTCGARLWGEPRQWTGWLTQRMQRRQSRGGGEGKGRGGRGCGEGRG